MLRSVLPPPLETGTIWSYSSLSRLPHRAFSYSLPDLEITCGNGPKSSSGLDGSSAQHDPALAMDHGTDDDFGILIGYETTGFAHIPKNCVPIGHRLGEVIW